MAASSSFVLAAAALLLLAVTAAAEAAGQQKETRMRVYWHDVVTGPNSTVAKVADAPTSRASATVFGTVYVIDDPLTDGPSLTAPSRLVGRAQGMYVSAGKETMSLLMAMSFVFAADGPYNGSSVAIFGPNPARPVREIPVVGGTGAFRFARGYLRATTYWYNAAGDATVQYDIHIRHD
ncbi:dirigent protein 23-like [Oryza glaberrima]|uniref:Dirigent protein n=1 Tax=Oryza glaberrima TaxID=4538 RepID=I1QY74_ORYGL|nr:dirigent protein 23-like [Oryza glaberrima]